MVDEVTLDKFNFIKFKIQDPNPIS